MITWLQGKAQIQAHLPLAVMRPVITYWTARYMAFCQLLILSSSLRSLVYADHGKIGNERLFDIPNETKKQKDKSVQMQGIIKNNVFWHNIAL
jgi:hypothetical protein